MEEYRSLMHRYGRIFTVLGIFVMLSVPFVILFVSGVKPNSTKLLEGILALSIIYLPGGIIEVLTYGPILGTSGTYLAFITGNLINLKIPCVMNARELANTRINTEENEIVSTIAVSFSSITTVVIMSLGVLLLVPLTPLLEAEVLQPAFNWVVSALFGALGYKYFKHHLKLVVAPLIVVVVISLIKPSFVYGNIVIVILIAAIVTLVVARILWKKNLI